MNLVSFWMTYIKTLVSSRTNDERGASLVEYALLVALIAVVCIVAIGFIGNSANDKFSEVGSAVGGA